MRVFCLHSPTPNLQPVIDYHIELAEGETMQRLLKSGADGEDEVKVLDVRANRTATLLAENHARVNALLDDLRLIRSDVNDLIGTANHELDFVRGLVDELKNSVQIERPDELVKRAEAHYAKIAAAVNTTAAHNLEAMSASASAESTSLVAVRDRIASRQAAVVDLQRRLHGLSNASRDHETKLADVNKTLEQTNAVGGKRGEQHTN